MGSNNVPAIPATSGASAASDKLNKDMLTVKQNYDDLADIGLFPAPLKTEGQIKKQMDKLNQPPSNLEEAKDRLQAQSLFSLRQLREKNGFGEIERQLTSLKPPEDEGQPKPLQ